MFDVRVTRSECARVARHARCVRVREDLLEAYAAQLPALPSHPLPEVTPDGAGDELRAAFHLMADAINFGSGWFPSLRKRDGRSGSMTVLLALRDFCAAAGGGWAPPSLAAVSTGEVAAVLGQDADHPLMRLYALHLRELGLRLQREHDGSFLALATHPRLAHELSTWPGFADVSAHAGRHVPFYKRAQLTAYDMACAGFVPPGGEGELTMFADNLVPHVLRVDGLLAYDAGLSADIEAGRLLLHGSRREVEIRACALHAVESIVACRPDLTAPGVDQLLWHRGQDARYKAQPRHRARCEAY
ncbi:MAG: Hypothetical protein DUF2419 [uncultured Solirubrobacteraceae bacterium]|uniref:Queuosine 5'-phosphate N-glycosylase/hydrolase n=1 Tax=uncultured Solirubrobacteraceae bacterium TaxID=1162706 RepID=A0A6J4RP41_9ACTN|nr:MAG: Hypothetical protein DUF2419 [uncultured Solirubrobacteraceae bacterium]